jgi:hypothetical protein
MHSSYRCTCNVKLGLWPRCWIFALMAYSDNDQSLSLNSIENQMPELFSHGAPDPSINFGSTKRLM